MASATAWSVAASSGTTSVAHERRETSGRETTGPTTTSRPLVTHINDHSLRSRQHEPIHGKEKESAEETKGPRRRGSVLRRWRDRQRPRSRSATTRRQSQGTHRHQPLGGGD